MHWLARRAGVPAALPVPLVYHHSRHSRTTGPHRNPVTRAVDPVPVREHPHTRVCTRMKRAGEPSSSSRDQPISCQRPQTHTSLHTLPCLLTPPRPLSTPLTSTHIPRKHSTHANTSALLRNSITHSTHANTNTLLQSSFTHSFTRAPRTAKLHTHTYARTGPLPLLAFSDPQGSGHVRLRDDGPPSQCHCSQGRVPAWDQQAEGRQPGHRPRHRTAWVGGRPCGRPAARGSHRRCVRGLVYRPRAGSVSCLSEVPITCSLPAETCRAL
jgi:hypothetical protein